MTELTRYLGEKAFNAVQDSIRKYVVAPANAFGLGGFVFSIESDTTVRQETDITDHYVENNSVVQDHAALRPAEITLRGYVGELVSDPRTDRLNQVQKVTQKLTTIQQYLPLFTDAAKSLKDSIEQKKGIDDNIEKALNLWELTKNLNPSANEQQKAFIYFQALQQQRILVGVQTPFRFYRNMLIQTLTAVQPEDSDQISEFTITLKEIRLASTQTVDFDPKSYQSRSSQQREETEDRGKVQGRDSSLLKDGVAPVLKAIKGLFE